MTRLAHRYGTSVASLQDDYTIYARTSRFVNREGAGPKLKKILEIFLSEGGVNFGSSHAGKSYKSGLQIEEYAESLNHSYGECCSFSNRHAVKRILTRLKEADLGISIVISGLIDVVVDMAEDVGTKPHTVSLSQGIHVDTSLLPDDNVLEITTMCGHSMNGRPLNESIIARVRTGEISPAEDAVQLAQPCPCGIFNVDRCQRLLSDLISDAQE